MIPTIGLMIGAYIITRMLHLTSRPEVSAIVRVFAVITAIIALGCIGLLIQAGTR
jgi:hypothetical protein